MVDKTFINENNAEEEGSCMHLSGGNQLIFKNIHFNSHKSTNGGCLSLERLKDLSIEKCIFSNNNGKTLGGTIKYFNITNFTARNT